MAASSVAAPVVAGTPVTWQDPDVCPAAAAPAASTSRPNRRKRLRRKMSDLLSYFWGSSAASNVLTQPHSFEVDWLPEVPGETRPRRHMILKGTKELYPGPWEINNLWENFLKGASVSGDGNCLGRRQPSVVGGQDVYVWQSYKEVKERVLDVGSALTHYKFARQTILGIFSINRPEWVISDQAMNAFNFTSCPLYDTLGPEAIEFIITQTDMPVIFLSADKIKSITDIRAKIPTVKLLVCFDKVTADQVAEAKKLDIELIHFEAFEKIGRANRSQPPHVNKDDLSTICYTSGTTGLPKGVMLSHHNLISSAHSVILLGQKNLSITITKDDVHISYLPLAHMMERIVMTFMLGIGAQVGFFSGDTTKLLEDIGILKPTFFASVPRLWNRIYDKVLAGVDAKGGVAKYLFETALAAKKEGLKQGSLTHWLWDPLVFSAIRARLGGRVTGMLSGSAPISTEVQDFLRVAFSAHFYEGYGQTENSAGTFVTLKGDFESGTVGPPLPMGEVKLVDIPEMGYTTKDKPFPRGEVCTRGYNTMKGYFKNPEKTREDLDADGWLHTGDVGLFDQLGRLKIIDRKKNIFKLAQGEYVAPEKVENVYQKTKYIAQAYVHGDSLKSYLVGIFVPDEETLLPWCKQNNIPGSTLAEVVTNPQVIKFVLDDANKSARAAGLKGFELVKACTLSPELFSVQNDILTPTFKLKRNVAKAKFKQQLDDMMAKVDAAEDAAKKAGNDK